ncbi:MAG: ABC transporter permease [Dermatophilaceae bacterium]|jgi:ribose/xylose/arabinose/galactoside ABC-type transport system permease subunit|nr:ABC transporter permease [Candidatus Phosphoribacter baldrii]MBK6954168.1 ABC transporter permease [Candidatus Phosphoribacter baldrii]MBK7610898.1 ABC transporter permease [Candidatus Phosphoribacter baldrii]MBP8881541.1 ABC transporter permease [Dermatophilaceae bacterium]MBP9919698.1 ABC transporter permease [Dermatophilaceae bacterium]
MATTTTADVKSKFDTAAFIKQYAIIGILIIFVVVLTFATGGKFLQTQNLLNVVTQVAAIGIIAIGMTFVIITLGIDLSVGSILAVAAVVSTSLAQLPSATAKYPDLHLPVIVAVLAGIAVGALAGWTNGFLIATFKIAPFIATLGMMSSARGLALIYSDGRPISRLDPTFNFLGQNAILGIPVPIIIFAIVAVTAHVILNYTRFGRHVYAIGGNEQAARVSGINLKRATIVIYTLCGLLAGIAGVISAGRIGSGNPQLGTGIELDAITAAVIGGTSFKGGIGTIWGTVIGALIIQSLNTGLVLLGMNDFVQMVVKGAIIIVAVILDERKNR